MPVLTVENKNEIKKIAFSGKMLLKDLLENENVSFSSPCGGKGNCGKCAVNVWGDISIPNVKELEFGCRLACQTVLYGDAYVVLPDNEENFAYIESRTSEMINKTDKWQYACAVDIGTTTVVLKLFDKNGFVCGGSALNPQRCISFDVMGRINASVQGKKALLQEQIVDCINNLLNNACETANIKKTDVENMVITGNTAMLYFLCGKDVSSISSAPFNADCLFGVEITSPFNAYLPPCISAFNGADTVCGVIASGMCDKDGTALFCDIGTNGELALWKNQKLYVTSAAAGPAFEGAEIKFGCGYINGAIDNVCVNNGRVEINVVGGVDAKGLCGSGLISAVSAYLELGYIDSTGKIDSDLKLSNEVYLCQDDIRAYQYAKSAIISGIEVLLERTNTSYDEVEKLYLSGGFGNNLSVDSACKTGLLPLELKEKTVFLGNAALHGSTLMLYDFGFKKKAEVIRKNSIHIELGGSDDFNKAFIDNLSFKEV